MPTDQIDRVLLVGAPNSGKTTLFNWMTGAHAQTVNFAGSTVEIRRGQTLPVYGDPLVVVDAPGIYSLRPHGPEEEVTRRALSADPAPRAVVVVIDGTQLNRQLYLVRQVRELGLPFVVALTMADLVKKNDRAIDLARLAALIDAPVVAVDGRLGGGVGDVLAAARGQSLKSGAAHVPTFEWDDAQIEREIAIAEDWTRAVVTVTPERARADHARRFDRVLLHPVFGVVAFLALMGGLFSSIFWAAAPVMELIDGAFKSAVDLTHQTLGPGLIADFLANGVLSGVGAVLVFTPQIFILFFGFSLLEDSGYLARAATIVDRPLNFFGLSGRSFVPLLSGFACAVPAIMATRNVRSPRERLITIFIIPFLTCSARLPVYALLLTFLFRGGPAWAPGLAMTGLYVASLVLGGIAAAILNRILGREGDSHFLMELPIYRWPNPRVGLRIALRRTTSYLRQAGPTILCFVLILFAGTHLPYHAEDGPTARLEQSVVGRAGRVIEPVFAPLGLDWRVGLGIMSAFVAREVFVSSLAVIFNITDVADETFREGLLARMATATTADGRTLFSTPAVVGLIVYFMIALQCLSTTGVAWRETGSARFAFVQLAVMNVTGYLAAAAVVAILRGLGY